MTSAKLICCLIHSALLELRHEATLAEKRNVVRAIETVIELPLVLGELMESDSGFADLEWAFLMSLSGQSIKRWFLGIKQSFEDPPVNGALLSPERKARGVLFYFIYVVFIEARSATVESKAIINQRMFKIANIFHNVPLRLNKVETGDCDDILKALQTHAQSVQLDDWLNSMIEKCAPSL